MRRADTVFALASGAGRSGVAVIRVSGPSSGRALKSMLGPQALPPPRQLVYRRIMHPSSGEILDRGMVAHFEKGRSFTGEEAVELHVHGGRATISAMLDSLGGIPGLRSADPGEFTKRAFLNGRMDLTEVEGLADLVNAETQSQRRQALKQYSGSLHKTYETWREDLLGCMAHVEAVIDFASEDEHISGEVEKSVVPRVRSLSQVISAHLADARRGERLRDGARVAIIGPPNAGKSSLINFFAQRQLAIVSPFAGTTRDVLEAPLDIGGYPVVLADTAGLRKTADPVEEEGVRRAYAQHAAADVRLCVFDGSTPLDHADETALELVDSSAIVLLNKMDMPVRKDLAPALGRLSPPPSVMQVSLQTGQGTEQLLQEIERRLALMFQLPTDTAVPSRARHRELLQKCVKQLEAYLAAPQDIDLAAEALRQAATCLGRITGRIDTEEVLDRVFREFCIGK